MILNMMSLSVTSLKMMSSQDNYLLMVHHIILIITVDLIHYHTIWQLHLYACGMEHVV